MGYDVGLLQESSETYILSVYFRCVISNFNILGLPLTFLLVVLRSE